MNKVYRIINVNTGEYYIGSTTRELEVRLQEHLKKSAKKVDNKFYKAIEHYGAQAFKIELLEEVSSTDELAEREIHYIDVFDSYRNGYNSDRGGGFRKTIYQYELGNHEHIASYDTLQEAADAVNASRKSISNACIGYNKTCKGFVWSYSTTYPLEVKGKGNVVHQYNLDGILLNTFHSAREASIHLNKGLSSITRCCRGERKQTSGFRFTYG